MHSWISIYCVSNYFLIKSVPNIVTCSTFCYRMIRCLFFPIRTTSIVLMHLLSDHPTQFLNEKESNQMLVLLSKSKVFSWQIKQGKITQLVWNVQFKVMKIRLTISLVSLYKMRFQWHFRKYKIKDSISNIKLFF